MAPQLQRTASRGAAIRWRLRAMKIAILGWASLVWNPQQLPHKGDWKSGGPRLPIEFSRVSKDGRLTLADASSHSRLEFDKQVDVVPRLSNWCKSNGFHAAVWTALPPQFQDQTGKPFSLDNAVAYLKSLPKSARRNALEYIQKAPQEVDTLLRKRLREERLIERDG